MAVGLGNEPGIENQTMDAGAAAVGWPSARSVVIGCLLCAVTGLLGPYWTIYMQTSRLYADYHTAGATFLLFVLFIVFNVVLGRLWRGFALRTDELMTVGAMLLVGGSIVSSGLIAYFIPSISSAYNLASASNQWQDNLWPSMPKVLAPLDPRGGIWAITRYWTGLRAGENIPWAVWAKPLAVWGVFLMSLFACMMAIMAIMRKQWVDYEHLSFPIAQVPMELCVAAGAPTAPGSIFRSKAFWLGLGITFVLAGYGGVSFYLGRPAYFRVRHTILFGTGGIWQLPVYLDIVVLGLAFLIPNRVAFTVWFVTLLAWCVECTLRSYNLQLRDGDALGGEISHMASGAMIVFVIASLWLSRAHLKRAWRCALGLGDRGYDRGEPASYLTAFIVALVGFAFAVVWLVAMKLRWPYALVLVCVTLAIYYTMARVVAQCGLPMLSPPIYPHHFMTSIFGSGSFGSRELAVLGSHMGWHFDMRNSPMSGAAQGMYLTTRHRSGLFWAMLLGLGITYVAACASAVWIGYRFGGSNMDPWFYGNFPRLPWLWARGTMDVHAGPDVGRIIYTAVGGAIMTALVIAQRTCFWWPLHPVGLLVCSSHMVRYFWFSVFMGWLIKVLLMTFGGPATFRPARRFFIGAVTGFFLAGGFWNVIDTITGATGNAVFYI